MINYSKYKPSGIEWLGDIPEHWDIKRLHNKCDIVRGNSSFKKDELLSKGKYVALQYGKTYKVEEINQSFNFYVNDEFYKSSQIVNYKDVILISTSETLEDLGHSVIYNREDIGLVGGEQILLKPNRKILDGQYLFYYSTIFGKELYKFATGVKVFRFDVDDLKTIYLPLPQISEQTVIANYLDEKTSKLDLLISNKKKQIKRLKEIRQIEINTAVTKGLVPNVKLKPSDVEWLGDVPRHWEVKRLKLIGENIGGLTYSPDDISEDESGTLVLRSSNIQNGKLSKKDNVYVNLEIPEKKKTYLDDILLCARNGSVALVGKNILINEETSGQSFGAFMSVFRSKYNRYIYWFFNSPIFSAQKGLFSTSTINQLTSGILYGMYSTLPPIEEQNAIAKYLDDKTSKIDQLVSNLENQIKQLQEIRKIEIYNAVTGKIKVA